MTIRTIKREARCATGAARLNDETVPGVWPMKRRSLLTALTALAGASLLRVRAAAATGVGRVRPGSPGWPADADWARLGREVQNRLEPVAPPSLSPIDAQRLLSNPIYLGDHPALTQASGWVDAWRSAPSAYVVKAKSAADVAAAVRFARVHNLRLVIRGGGHSYLGGSNAPDSLLVWTRGMDAITLHDAFVPEGCSAAPVPAVSVGSGCTWGHVYAAVTTDAGRYVQGGGCTTVGVAGLVLGGGFGNFSKAYGMAAASLLEAEIVTADGVTRIVNARRERQLFWALKGGGGGAFGVVTRLTLRTHDLPETVGAAFWTIRARSDAAFRRLLEQFLDEYAACLFNPHWGETATASRRNELIIDMVFHGLNGAGARSAWAGLAAYVAAHPEDYDIVRPFGVLALPARHFWDKAYLSEHVPSAISSDDQPGARPEDWWWAGDGGQAGGFWHGYSSAWLPAALLQGQGRARLADAWFAASRHWSVALHFNKGLAGSSSAAEIASRDTAMNPEVLDAFALAIIAGEGPSAFPGLPTPDMEDARDDAARIREAMRTLREAAPGAGSYLSECDYFIQDWQGASWGGHWTRLSQIKRRYDPEGLFVVHHGVGSEAWSPDGFTRVA